MYLRESVCVSIISAVHASKPLLKRASATSLLNKGGNESCYGFNFHVTVTVLARKAVQKPNKFFYMCWLASLPAHKAARG